MRNTEIYRSVSAGSWSGRGAVIARANDLEGELEQAMVRVTVRQWLSIMGGCSNDVGIFKRKYKICASACSRF